MAKQSGYLQKLAAQQAVRDEKTRRFTLQQCKDMMLITMHEDFGWGEERLKKLSDCYDQTFMTYAEMCLADAKTDKQIWFTQGKVDERLKKACGKYFVPWDERYRYGSAMWLDRVQLEVRSELAGNDANVWKGYARFIAGFNDWRGYAVGGVTGGTQLIATSTGG